MSPETIKARVKRDSPGHKRIQLQRFSTDTSPSESTDNTFATANSHQHPSSQSNSHIPDSPNDNDDTIRVNVLSHTTPETLYLDQTPTQESINTNAREQDYMSRRNLNMEPLSPRTNPESIVSSSSMWDELESIKRRLRNLEMNHSSPSINGSIAPGTERPHTRGTATSSSSPQRSSPFPSYAGTSLTSPSSPSTYPLLNAALTKLKSSQSSTEITHAIEITAQEAISLNLLAQDPMQSPSPRMIRRKVDGICRGLTEICLALADTQHLSQRQQARVSQYRAEDFHDSSPLSNSSRQSLTLSRSTARRLSVGTNNTSRASPGSMVSRARRPVHSVVGVQGEDFEDEALNTVSRPGLSRYNTIQYRPLSRAATEVYGARERERQMERDTPPALQRFSTSTRKGLGSRHGPSLSDHQVPSDHDSPASEGRPTRSSTFTASALASAGLAEDRRRQFFSSPPRTTRTEVSGLPTPPSRPVSLISPPRVNVQRNSDSGERTDETVRTETIRRRPTLGSVPGEKVYHSDLEEVRSTTLGRTNSARRGLAGSEIRRTGSITRRTGNGNGNSIGNGNGKG